jgi:hypothetical protein
VIILVPQRLDELRVEAEQLRQEADLADEWAMHVLLELADQHEAEALRLSAIYPDGAPKPDWPSNRN